MITKHITDICTKFNPFKKSAKTCRVFLAHLPANARLNMRIYSKVLPRTSREKSELKLKFSMFGKMIRYVHNTDSVLRGWQRDAIRHGKATYKGRGRGG